MATEISNGNQTVKLYRSVNRGKAMYQVAFYPAGKRIQKNFQDKSKAMRTADQILRGLTLDAKSVDSLLTPDLESLVAARKALAPNYAPHVAAEEHAQAAAGWVKPPCGKRWSSSCGTIELMALEAGNSPEVIFGHYRELVTPDAVAEGPQKIFYPSFDVHI